MATSSSAITSTIVDLSAALSLSAGTHEIETTGDSDTLIIVATTAPAATTPIGQWSVVRARREASRELRRYTTVAGESIFARSRSGSTTVVVNPVS